MKKNLLILILVLQAFVLSAQSLGVTCYNNPNIYNPEFRRLTLTSDGGFIAHSGSSQIAKAIKLNSALLPDWSFEISGIAFMDNIEMLDGNYLFLAIDIPLSKVHLFKFSPMGVLIWQKSYSTPNGFLSVNGLVRACGSDSGFVFFGGMSANVMHYLVKGDINGNIQWSKEYAGFPGAGSFTSMLTEPQGYSAVAFYGWNQIYSAAIVQLDSVGNVLANKELSSNTSNGGIEGFLSSLSKLSNGDYFLWTHPLTISGAINFTISSSLNTITCNEFSASSGIFVDAVPTHNTNDEVMMMFSYYNNADGGFLLVNPAGVISTQKYSPAGGIIPHEAIRMNNGTTVLGGYVGAQNHFGSMIAVIDDSGNGLCNSANAAYTSQSNFPFVSTTLSLSTTNFNLIVAPDTFNLDPIIYAPFNICGNLTEVKEPEIETSLWVAFPNPASSIVKFEFEKEIPKHIYIYDATGRIVFEDAEISNSTLELNVATWPKGIYLVQVISANQIQQLKLIVK
jgi:Secretion system C-terminal sorting domain